MMTREEAIKTIEFAKTYISKDGLIKQALDLAISALSPVSRERLEKVWPGCPKCKYEGGREPMRIYYPDGWDNGIGFEYGNAIFCPECGRPLTDEAVDMMLERWKEAVE